MICFLTCKFKLSNFQLDFYTLALFLFCNYIYIYIYMQTSLLFEFSGNHACYHRSRPIMFSIHQKVFKTLLLISEWSYQYLKQHLLTSSTLKHHILLLDSLLLKVPSSFLKPILQRYRCKWRVLKKHVIWNRGLYTAWELWIFEYQIHKGSSLGLQFVYLNLIKDSSLSGE